MIALQLTREEARFLAEQLRRHLQTVENELVHTDVRRMQHELAVDLDRLRDFQERLRRASLEEGEQARVTAPIAP